MNAVAETFGELSPAGPIVFAEAVFDGENGVVVDNPLIPIGEIGAGLPVAVGFELIVVVDGKFGCRNIHCDGDVLAGREAGGLDGELDELERFIVAVFDERSIAAFIANGSGVVAGFEDFFQRMEDFGAHAYGGRDGIGANGNDHVFLKVS